MQVIHMPMLAVPHGEFTHQDEQIIYNSKNSSNETGTVYLNSIGRSVAEKVETMKRLIS
jgi:hypothetical protein